MAGGEDPRAVTVVQVAAGEAHTLALTGAHHMLLKLNQFLNVCKIL